MFLAPFDIYSIGWITTTGVFCIRTLTESRASEFGISAQAANEVSDHMQRKMTRGLKKGRRRLIQYGLLSVNMALMLGVAAFVMNARGTHVGSSTPVLSLASEQTVAGPLDSLSGADIALNVALMSGMNEASSVVHNVDAETVKKDVAPSGSQSIAKPQILKTELKSKGDIVEYTVTEGDTIESIAQKFGVSSKSISWSNNNLTNTAMNVGSTIHIPPVEGIVHEVRDGDTPATLAAAFNSSEPRIVAFNDAEIGGLHNGELIVIPDGQAPVVTTPSNNVAAYVYNFTAAYAGNAYTPGNCTWHVANKRAAVGKPLPSNLGNAATWAVRAAAAGLPTGKVPMQHAAVVTSQAGWGHVGFVVEVYDDGSFLMSEMNYNWQLYAVRERVVPPEEGANYAYIY